MYIDIDLQKDSFDFAFRHHFYFYPPEQHSTLNVDKHFRFSEKKNGLLTGRSFVSKIKYLIDQLPEPVSHVNMAQLYDVSIVPPP